MLNTLLSQYTNNITHILPMIASSSSNRCRGAGRRRARERKKAFDDFNTKIYVVWFVIVAERVEHERSQANVQWYFNVCAGAVCEAQVEVKIQCLCYLTNLSIVLVICIKRRQKAQKRLCVWYFFHSLSLSLTHTPLLTSLSRLDKAFWCLSLSSSWREKNVET
jgi:hypothetical protein